jgi:hypothetical protein
MTCICMEWVIYTSVNCDLAKPDVGSLNMYGAYRVGASLYSPRAMTCSMSRKGSHGLAPFGISHFLA